MSTMRFAYYTGVLIKSRRTFQFGSYGHPHYLCNIKRLDRSGADLLRVLRELGVQDSQELLDQM